MTPTTRTYTRSHGHYLEAPTVVSRVDESLSVSDKQALCVDAWDLPPVGLERLNSEAELQSRVDTKYLMTASDAAALPGLLPSGSTVLEIDGQRRFSYHSVYFDTPNLDSYLGSATDRRRRFKVRTRAYCDSEIAFLEVKVRGPRRTTNKSRIIHDFDQLDTLRAFDTEFVATELERGRMDPNFGYLLRPQLATGYQRTTFVVPGRLGPTRVTVDSGLYWEELAGDPLGEHPMLFRPGLAIVETKSLHRGNEVDKLLWNRGHRPESVSKYCVGSAVLDPRLPANKWHRIVSALSSKEGEL